MEKLTKVFSSGEVLKAQDLNNMSSKVNELVDDANAGGGSAGGGDIGAKLTELQKKVDFIYANCVVAEDMNATLSLSSISINDGVESTSELSVNVRFTFSGSPTHYMISESSSFAGATWVSFANPATFNLSSGNGTKTLYAKIKDSSKESVVKNDSITYSYTTEVALTSLTVNEGAEYTSSQQVNIKFGYTGTPTHYMISENSSFTGATWVSFANPATFNLSAGEGLKTIYGKIKNIDNESSVVSDSINYSTTIPLSLTAISINNGASSTAQQQVSVKFTYAGTPTHYMLSESSSFAGAAWTAFASPVTFNLSESNGNKTIYAKIKDASSESSVKSSSISYSKPISGNIVFSDPEFKRVMVNMYDTNSDGEISVSEAEAVKEFGSELLRNKIVTNMNELKYFKNTTPVFNGPFNECTALQSIEYPDNWTITGSELKDCTSLSHVILPLNLTSIPNGAFQNCTSLESIEFPSNLKTLGINTFINSGLVNITIPDNITDIGNLGLNCTKLKKADLGSGVKNIGQQAFTNCPIETLIIRAITPPTCGYAVLKDVTPNIYVPDESVATYKSEVWFKPHATRIYPLSEYQS